MEALSCNPGSSQRWRAASYAGYLIVLILLFLQPLSKLFRHAARSDLHSFILLVPLVTAYLLHVRRASYPDVFSSSIAGSVILAASGITALAARFGWRGRLSINDELALFALGFVSLIASGGFLFLGSKWMSAAAFPISFLILMAPLPDAVVRLLERGLVLSSAEAAALFFKLSGMPFERNGTLFDLPGIPLQVSEECSGIHSSWVLFISSTVASHLFLKSGWRRIALVAFVVPIGILRNGFRILVIGLLCVHVDPRMIDSFIHRRGGPLFFALSLIPVFLLLWWLRRQERRLNSPAEDG